MNEQELNKKLAEWAGFEWWSIHRQEDIEADTIWEPLGGVEVLIKDNKGDMPGLRITVNGKESYAPDFTNSLDACFEWLVPKVYPESVTFDYTKPLLRCTIKYFQHSVIGEGDTEAVALCKAIEKKVLLNG